MIFGEGNFRIVNGGLGIDYTAANIFLTEKETEQNSILRKAIKTNDFKFFQQSQYLDTKILIKWVSEDLCNTLKALEGTSNSTFYPHTDNLFGYRVIIPSVRKFYYRDQYEQLFIEIEVGSALSKDVIHYIMP